MNMENNSREAEGTQASLKMNFETDKDLDDFVDNERNEENLLETTKGNESIQLVHSKMQK